MKSPWLTTAEACEHLRFVDPKTGAHKLKALYEFLKRHQIETWSRGGRSILIRKDALDEALTPRTKRAS